MTENQRDYLADLANAKGVNLADTDDKSAAWASAKIEELKAMPDAEFRKITEEESRKIDEMTQAALDELHLWGFER